MQTIKLSGLTCPACKKLIEKRVAAISGVNVIEVDVVSGEATIDSDRDIQLSEIKEVLKGTPYQVIK
ncbi:hypothetical protein A3A84_03155 [Candidatus Collierbacteria bacterium RIFCSPLOWO2_01_FULL_50_23]|uniref:HMA domain-containing protein n=2 Tax=Candidatus Collieribacteriota TaxID=1752725 RepID=A0A1F5EWG4_9BACT|nr:MAG: hypothetical protein A3D09_03175 [Candidatus Collierbacteria bacterium RIFCSPHIGHO2_02_FULL_49_10]OGD71927.1 MAG: hypothetical protein A2703_00905 [Candidatus Collierbacteria bacterium RIFCSPHIGHO2_01_FULL_50_25]OGD74792.1 MAG: hypothetical protein A3A84_03155 [Candidatus Collierbacteria bacterium RIFCSPLOWO2_01_FULL_50_23]